MMYYADRKPLEHWNPAEKDKKNGITIRIWPWTEHARYRTLARPLGRRRQWVPNGPPNERVILAGIDQSTLTCHDTCSSRNWISQGEGGHVKHPSQEGYVAASGPSAVYVINETILRGFG